MKNFLRALVMETFVVVALFLILVIVTVFVFGNIKSSGFVYGNF